VLELGRVREEEAVEERPPIERRRRGVTSVRQRRLELRDVGTDHARVQPQVGAGGEEHGLAERLAEAVDGLVEEVAGVLGVAVRPEQGLQALATPAPLGRDREHGEEREAVPLGGAARDRLALRLEGNAAEELEGENRLAREAVEPAFTGG
jgi:hypothetical protein